MGFNTSKDEDDGAVNELVEMIDRLMNEGSGQLVINIDESSDEIKVETCMSNDCTGKQSACCQPNEKVDDDD